MYEEDGGGGATRVLREPLADHREGHLPPAQDELLNERRLLAPVDGLFESAPVEDQAANGPAFRIASARTMRISSLFFAGSALAATLALVRPAAADDSDKDKDDDTAP